MSKKKTWNKFQIVFKRKQWQGNSPLASDRANRQEHKKSKSHIRLPIERCPITAPLIVNFSPPSPPLWFERRLVGYLWTHGSVYIYIHISFSWIGDFLTFEWLREKREMLLMGYSIGYPSPFFLFLFSSVSFWWWCFPMSLIIFCFIMKPLEDVFFTHTGSKVWLVSTNEGFQLLYIIYMHPHTCAHSWFHMRRVQEWSFTWKRKEHGIFLSEDN